MSPGVPRNMKAQNSLRVSALFANSECLTLPSPSWTAAQQQQTQALELYLCPCCCCQDTRLSDAAASPAQSGSFGVFCGPVSPAYFNLALDQIFGVLEAHSRGKTALPHTLATRHGSTPCKELDDCKGSQMLEGKQWWCAT